MLAQYTVVNIYAVLIATPEAVRVLTGSRILIVVYIYILAMQQNGIYRLIIKQRKPNVIEQYTPVISMYISDSHPVFCM